MEEESKPFDDINVTPLLDLSWTLLIIFILMTTAAVQGTRVDLPKANKAETLSKPRTKAITVNEEGHIYLDTLPVSIEELELRLADERTRDPDFPVVIRGGDLVHYQSIIQVVDVLGRVGVEKVGLATQPLQ